MKRLLLVTLPVAAVVAAAVTVAQPPHEPGPQSGDRTEQRQSSEQEDFRQRRGGPEGRGPRGLGPGGPGGPNRQERKLLDEYDVNDSGWLENDERKSARAAMATERSADSPDSRQPGRRGFGGPPGRGGAGFGPPGETAAPTSGKRVSPEEVTSYPDAELYDPSVLRTIFLEFENEDWEAELEDFRDTDVEVPAQMIVDGKAYADVGVHFRGMSSYHHVSRGSKRSLNVSLDFLHDDQRLYGYTTLNLLNSHGDPSMMSSVVYSHIARQFLPAPKANFVHVVINSESWGIYDNVQQFDKIFVKENFEKSKGTRWKVSGNPGADGGLRFLGEDLEEYRSRFQMKSNDGKKAWNRLILLCKTLNETPLEQLEAALAPLLDIDNALKFLAVDNALVNSDGYWTRASDYSLFLDADGRFHVLPHDMNEAFALSGHGGGPGRGPRGGPPGDRPERDQPGGGPGGRGGFGPPPGFGEFFGPPGRREGGRGPGGPSGRGPGGGPEHGSVELDPLIGLDNDRMPLRSRLLNVPALRARYMDYVHQIATDALAWEQLGPAIEQYRDLIEPVVREDTRKLTSYDAFLAATSTTDAPVESASIRKFAVERSQFLLDKR